jgi:hypothetical protein
MRDGQPIQTWFASPEIKLSESNRSLPIPLRFVAAALGRADKRSLNGSVSRWGMGNEWIGAGEGRNRHYEGAWPGISPNPLSINSERASTAAWASSPIARKQRVVPFTAPNVNKSRMLLPLIISFPFRISTLAEYWLASFMNMCAGRAWNP